MSTTTTPPVYTYSLLRMPLSYELIQRSDGLVIPPDPANPNFAAWQAWINAGNRPTIARTPTRALDAEAMIASGLSVVSTSNASLNATYRCDGFAMLGMQAEANAILISNPETFADGTTTLLWPDHTGATHTFNVDQFKSLIWAMANFVAQVSLYAAGATSTMPASTATIP